VKVLAFARSLGAKPIYTVLVGCEPVPLNESEEHAAMQMGLSEPVRASIDEAVKMIDSLVDEFLAIKR